MNTEPTDLAAAVAAVLNKYSKQLEKRRILIALSGGVDSVSLLYVSAALKEYFGFSLRCIHVNHRLRPPEETDHDGLIIKQHCKKLKVPLTIVNIAPGAILTYAKQHKVGIEAAARYFRHRAFKRQMHRWSGAWLFLGHTRDDALELALMRFLRGSGPAGLAQLTERRGRIVRPLVYSSRKEIESYAAVQGLLFAKDSTNQDNHYLRNRIRNKLMPLLDREFSFWRTGVLEAAHTQAEVASFISEASIQAITWQEFINEKVYAYQTEGSQFFHQPVIVREEGLFHAINMLRDKKRTSIDFLNADEKKLKSIKTIRRSSVRKFAVGITKALDLPECRLINAGPWVQVQEKKQICADAGFSVIIKTSGLYPIEEILIRIEPGITGASDDHVKGIALPCIIRIPQLGDRLMFRGRMRTLSELRKLNNSGPLVKQYLVEDTLGIAVYIIIDIHSKIHIYWRDSLPEAVERKANFMLEILLRGNHAQRSER